MKEYDATWRNMWKIWRNIKKYVKNVMEYEEICQFPYIYMGLGTGKNSTSELPPALWDLEKFRSSSLHLHNYMEIGSGILSPASIQALGFEKMLSFPFLRLQPVDEAPSVARCEVSLFCLLHISSKLFLLIYSCKPQMCECLGRWLPQTRAMNPQHVSS